MIAYCDKIADVCRKALCKHDPDGIVGLVFPLQMDLDPVEGFLVSTKKTFEVSDMDGKMYRVTIEEV